MKGRRGKRAAAAAALLAAALAVAAVLRQAARPPADAGEGAAGGPAAVPSVTEMLSTAGEGFSRARGPRDFTFPDDHGPHPGFRTEWWYITGNLEAAGTPGARPGRFGFQLTFFRNRLAADPPARSSDWAAADVYMAHFALTSAGGPFRAFERFARGAAGLAGARARPFRVWLEDWEAAAEAAPPVPEGSAGNGAPPATPPLGLAAAADGVALDLTLAPGKPPVLHGEAGLSRKGPEPGNASYYYSLTRMPARGTVTSEGRVHAVEGLAWMDREWSTSALSAGQVGWDWFGLQLDDGRELMLFRLRRQDGSPDPRSAGTLVAEDGSSRALAWDEVELEVLDRWRSPRSGAVYPSRWRIGVPAYDLDLLVEPLREDQELDLSFRYWEGAVTVRDAGGGAPAGRGYTELTGYEADRRPGR